MDPAAKPANLAASLWCVMDFLQGIDVWIRLLVIGMLAGWLASLILRERRRSIFGYLIVGVVGSFVGYYIFVLVVGGQPHDIVAHLIAALAGALVLIAGLRLFRRR
jgi:uncharacterized membrane protein YeaQ/YmgE (transglycosylase-associated protein family)